LAQAKEDCRADETCKSIVDVSLAFGYEHFGEEFMLCTSGAEEVEDSDLANVYIKEQCFQGSIGVRSQSGTPDKCFAKIENKTCTIDNIKDTPASYVGLKGLAQAKEDCRADETCKSIVDVSLAFGFERFGEEFMLCTSGAEEVEDSDLANVYIKEQCPRGRIGVPIPRQTYTLVDILAMPVVVNLDRDTGNVINMVFSKNEPEWSINFKKGILSQLISTKFEHVASGSLQTLRLKNVKQNIGVLPQPIAPVTLEYTQKAHAVNDNHSKSVSQQLSTEQLTKVGTAHKTAPGKCTLLRHLVQTEEGKMCVSQVRVTLCSPSCRPKNMAQKAVPFTCLPQGRLGKHYWKKANLGQELPELATREAAYTVQMNMPSYCIRA